MTFRGKEDDTKNLKDEEISDRTPILDILIEKWKFFNKYMKNMIEKYSKNSVALSEALERIMKYLGLEHYSEIPILLEKNEEQLSNIEMFLSKLSIEQYAMEEQKRFTEMKIKQLEMRSSSISVQRQEFIDQKKEKIAHIKRQTKELKEKVDQKESFFAGLKEPTDNFLISLEKAYISEYIPLRIPVNKDAWYNEQNIVNVLANVQDYLNVSEEFEKDVSLNLQSKQSSKPLLNVNQQINKELEKMKIDLKNKIDALKSTNYLKNNIKDRTNAPYNEAIKKLSEELVEGNISVKIQDSKNATKKKKEIGNQKQSIATTN